MNELRARMLIPDVINYGTVHTPEMLYNTTRGWDAQNTLISKSKTIYVYTDHEFDEKGEPVAAFKIGDGNAYLIDLPFYTTVSVLDKEFWNNKVRCYVPDDDPEHVIFTTN